jgi:two-component system, chemotaxis family, protein-glutamate methylesterase/glutaminase
MAPILPTDRGTRVAHRDILVMGASAGGIDGFREIVSAFPRDFDASVFIVLHIPPDAPSRLAAILDRHTALPVTTAEDGGRIEPGHIYVAPPDHHLILDPDKMRVVRGPRENRHRPAIDPLFRSAARSFGARVVGVLLSGLLDDGTNGLQVIHARGGVSVVQDPSEAEYSTMPHNAIEFDSPDYVMPVAQIGPLLVQLAGESVPAKAAVKPAPAKLNQEVGVAEMNMEDIQAERAGEPSAFACPECNGVLWEVRDADLVRFRCRVGHAYSSESLLTAKSEELEAALWGALRALEESAAMSRRMASRASKSGHTHSHTRLTQQASEQQHQAAILRDMLLWNGNTPAHADEEAKTGTEG